MKGMRWVQTMKRGILAAFVGILGLVLYNLGMATFAGIPSAFFTAGAFLALLRKVDLAYILSARAALLILIFGNLW